MVTPIEWGRASFKALQRSDALGYRILGVAQVARRRSRAPAVSLWRPTKSLLAVTHAFSRGTGNCFASGFAGYRKIRFCGASNHLLAPCCQRQRQSKCQWPSRARQAVPWCDHISPRRYVASAKFRHVRPWRWNSRVGMKWP